MVNELAESLEPSVPQEEIEAATAEIAEQEKALEAPKAEAEGETAEGEQKAPEKPPKGFVPQGALHEERARRKELQSQLQQLSAAQEQQRRVLEDRLNQLQYAWQQQNQPQAPSYEDDPVNALKHGVETTQAELQQMRAWQQDQWHRQQYAEQQQNYIRQLESRVADDVREFSETTPDYLEAINDLRGRRVKQHMALGAPEQRAVQMVLQEEYQLAAAALQNGRSPAQAAYEIALAYGYTKKEAQQASENAQKMETLQNGVKAAKSLGSGGTPTGKLTVDAVAQMSDDDFADFMRKGGWNKLG